MIRLATAADVATVERVVQDAYAMYVARMGKPPAPMHDDYAARIAAGSVYVLEDGDVVGVLVVVPERDALLLDNVAVAPAAQHRGLGGRLIAFAEQHARDLGLKAVRLYTNELMVENISLYSRLGYCETHRAEEDGYRRIFMVKTLFSITALHNEPEVVSALSELLVETVAHGGSVSFMHPVDPGEAAAFWKDSLESAERGERIVLAAWDAGTLIGTVTVIFCGLPNQRHRAEIAKMMTRVAWRRRGVARALMEVAEREALAQGRTLLVLDTAVQDGAGPFYEGLGFQKAGVIPDYALLPHGGFTGTIYYWKQLAPHRL